MRKPPVPKKQQIGFVQTSLRLPPKLHAEIKQQAESSDKSLNAVILDRLQSDQVKALRQEVAEMRAMLREVLDIVRDKL